MQGVDQGALRATSGDPSSADERIGGCRSCERTHGDERRSRKACTGGGCVKVAVAACYKGLARIGDSGLKQSTIVSGAGTSEDTRVNTVVSSYVRSAKSIDPGRDRVLSTGRSAGRRLRELRRNSNSVSGLRRRVLRLLCADGVHVESTSLRGLRYRRDHGERDSRLPKWCTRSDVVPIPFSAGESGHRSGIPRCRKPRVPVLSDGAVGASSRRSR